MSFMMFRRLMYTVMFIISLVFCFLIVDLFVERNESTHIIAQQQAFDVQNLIAFKTHLNQAHFEAPLDSKTAKLFVNELSIITHANATLNDSMLMNNALDFLAVQDEACRVVLTQKEKINQEIDLLLQQLLTLSQSEFESYFLMHRLLPLIVGYLLLMFLFNLLSSYVATELLNRALRKLSYGAKKLQSGAYDFRFKSDRREIEIEQVKESFNLMAQHLLRQKIQLQRTHDVLLKTLMNLQESHAYKDQFLANMSHELRTPLSAIIGFAELLFARGEAMDLNKKNQMLTQIIKSSEHLLELIADLLKLAQLQADKREPICERVHLEDLFDQVTQMMRVVAMQKQIEFTYTMDLKDETFVCVRLGVQQILINLLQNAIKFTPENGVVNLLICDSEEMLTFRVSDTGIGISEEDQSKLFIDFYRAESSYTANTQGVGLGLTLVRKWVDFHDGRVILKSVLNQGTVFEVILPKKKGGNE